MKWREKDKKAIKDLVHKYNAKVKYWENKGELAPQKIYLKDIKRHIWSREDFNYIMKIYGKYLERGEGRKVITTKSGNTLTKYEYDLKKKLWRRKKRYNEKYIEKLKNTEVVVDGKPMGYTYADPHADQSKIEQHRTTPFILDEEKPVSKKRWELFSKSMDMALSKNPKLIQDQQYKENYIKALKKNNIPTRVIKAVEKLNPEEVVRLLDENYLETVIRFVYDEFNHELVVDRLLAFWCGE